MAFVFKEREAAFSDDKKFTAMKGSKCRPWLYSTSPGHLAAQKTDGSESSF
jgi:hypothetical protein